MVCVSDVNDSIANVFVAHLLELISIKLHVNGTIVRERWDWGRWEDFIGWELSDTFLVADRFEFIALNRADSEHTFVFEAELFILALVSFGVGISVLVELNNGNTFLSIGGDDCLVVLGVKDLYSGLSWIVKTFSACKRKQSCD